MIPVDPRDLKPGQRLGQNLYSRAGSKLLSRGSILTPDLCDSLRQLRGQRLYFAATSALAKRAAQSRQSGTLVAASVGPVWPATEIESKLTSGLEQTSSAVNDLHARAVASWSRSVRTGRDVVEARMPYWSRLSLRIKTGVHPWLENWGAQDETIDHDRLLRARDVLVNKHAAWLNRLADGDELVGAETASIVSELMALCRRSPGAFGVIAKPKRAHDEGLAAHGIAVAALSVGIAAQLGFSSRDVRTAGFAGLLCDVGMTLVPTSVRNAIAPLTDVELCRMRRHPLTSVVMLDEIKLIPPASLLAIYQHHERENGAGYPIGLRGGDICDIARVVAAADTFTALASEREFRPRLSAHEAMRQTITLAGRGSLHRKFVRSLLHVVGLFPVGSAVLISDGSEAVVQRANGDDPARPVVRRRRRTAMGGVTFGEELDLARERSVRITGVLEIEGVEFAGV